MSLFGKLGSLAGKGLRSVSALEHVPFVGTALKALPVVGTALTVADLASSAYNAFGPSSAPAASPSGGLPALPPAPGQTGGFGLPRGPGGHLQLPTSDPSIAAALKPYSLDDSFLKIRYHAPKGYVVMRDPQGRPFAVLKSMAKHYGWKPHRKPPISVGEWHALKKAHRTVKKVHKIHGIIQYVSSHTTAHGKVKVARPHKKGHAK